MMSLQRIALLMGYMDGFGLYIQHLISGYIPIIPVLLLYFFISYKKGHKNTLAHVVLTFVFCFYLLGILTMTGIWWFQSFSPRFVWIPFIDMLRGPIDTALNILLFIPLGLFLPLLYEKFDKIRHIAFAGFLISLSVEIVQMFGCGITDINDLITNTVGVCIGYFVYLMVSKIAPKTRRMVTQSEGMWCYFEPAFCWMLSLVIMMTIQPSIFHYLF